MIETIIYLLILLELVFVGTIDIKFKKISNYWSLIHLFTAIIFYFKLRYIYPFSWEIFIFPGIFLIGGFILFLLNIMGAGDSKFLATLFLIIPLEYHLPFMEKIILSTMITGGLLMLLRMIKSIETLGSYLISGYWFGLKSMMKSSFSFAPVVAVAWILLGLHLW